MANNEQIIRIRPDSVMIETIRDGQKSVKHTNLRAIQEVFTRGERIETPLLPSQWGVLKYMRVNNREMYVLATEPHIRTVKYDYRDESLDRIKEYSIPLPGFVWFIFADVDPRRDTRRYAHGMAYALKNPIISENDRLFVFPFSNCNSTYMCWGGSSDYPALAGSKSIQTVPDRFLSNPFNSDLDSNKFAAFTEEVNGQRVDRFRTMHLIEHLHKLQQEAQKKGENATFKYDLLHQGPTFKDAMQNVINRNMRG